MWGEPGDFLPVPVFARYVQGCSVLHPLRLYPARVSLARVQEEEQTPDSEEADRPICAVS